MKNRDVVVAINAMNKVANSEAKIAYELRRGIRRNHPEFMKEYKILEEERNRLRAPIKDVKVEELSADERQRYEEEKAVIEEEIMKLLDKDVDIKIEKVSEAFLRDSELSLADEMALEFMLIAEEGGDK